VVLFLRRATSAVSLSVLFSHSRHVVARNSEEAMFGSVDRRFANKWTEMTRNRLHTTGGGVVCNLFLLVEDLHKVGPQKACFDYLTGFLAILTRSA
jgi:hypothetical protein